MYVGGQEETHHIKYQERSMQKDFFKGVLEKEAQKMKMFFPPVVPHLFINYLKFLFKCY